MLCRFAEPEVPAEFYMKRLTASEATKHLLQVQHGEDTVQAHFCKCPRHTSTPSSLAAELPTPGSFSAIRATTAPSSTATPTSGEPDEPLSSTRSSAAPRTGETDRHNTASAFFTSPENYATGAASTVLEQTSSENSTAGTSRPRILPHRVDDGSDTKSDRSKPPASATFAASLTRLKDYDISRNIMKSAAEQHDTVNANHADSHSTVPFIGDFASSTNPTPRVTLPIRQTPAQPTNTASRSSRVSSTDDPPRQFLMRGAAPPTGGGGRQSTTG